MRITEELIGPRDGRKRKSMMFKHGRQVGRRFRRHAFAQHRHHPITRDDTLVFGLPGNPVAAFVCTLVFARPVLFRLAGAPWERPAGITLYPTPLVGT